LLAIIIFRRCPFRISTFHCHTGFDAVSLQRSALLPTTLNAQHCLEIACSVILLHQPQICGPPPVNLQGYLDRCLPCLHRCLPLDLTSLSVLDRCLTASHICARHSRFNHSPPSLVFIDFSILDFSSLASIKQSRPFLYVYWVALVFLPSSLHTPSVPFSRSPFLAFIRHIHGHVPLDIIAEGIYADNAQVLRFQQHFFSISRLARSHLDKNDTWCTFLAGFNIAFMQ
jgi:hypothetical protein